MITVKLRPKRTEQSQDRKIQPKRIPGIQKGTSIGKKVNKSNEETDTSLESKYANNAKRYEKIVERAEGKGKKQIDQQILYLSNEIKEEPEQKFIFDESQNNWFFIIKEKFHELLSYYIEEEIIKHYCSKTGWQFQNKLIQSRVIPTLDLLSIRREDLKLRFQPFLQKITQKYLLKTELDTFSRLSSSALLIEITYVWLKIKQAQISLKREIRNNLKEFRAFFCEENSYVLNRQKMYSKLFKDSRDLKMVNVIKLYMFLFKIEGEDGAKGIEGWLQEY